MKTKQAMILAAGFGTRMKDYTKNQPKPLLKIAQYPLLVYTLFLLYQFKVDSVVINLHYQKDKIKDFLKNFPFFPIYFSEEEKILGTAGGIAYAIYQNLLSSYFLVINPDTIFFPSFNPFEDIPLLEKFFIDHLLYIQKKDIKHKNERGFTILEDMKEYCQLNFTLPQEPNEYFYTGLSIFHESFFDYYKSDGSSFKKELSELLKRPLGKFYQGIRIDCGTKEDYEELNATYSSPLEIIPERMHKDWFTFIKDWGI